MKQGTTPLTANNRSNRFDDAHLQSKKDNDCRLKSTYEGERDCRYTGHKDNP